MQVALRAQRGSASLVWIAEDVLSGIRSSATRYAPLETGGLLLGYRQGRVAVITDWVGAGPGAVHKDDYFEPDYDYQERDLANRYESSGRVHSYLGDWHTHPHGALVMSRIDRRTLRTIAGHRKARNSSPLMMIFGPATDWRFKCWRWRSALSPGLGYPSTVGVRTFAKETNR